MALRSVIQTPWTRSLIRLGTSCGFWTPEIGMLHSPAKVADALLPVDIYIGGIEHAILHLLYARFVSKFLATTSLWPGGLSPHIRGEPFKKLISQGMVHGKTFSDPHSGRFLRAHELDLNDLATPKILGTGETPKVSFEKMSKSKHNGVDPTTCIQTYGADVVRAHMLFQAPVTEILEWDELRIIGIQRWFGEDLAHRTRLLAILLKGRLRNLAG